MRIQTILEVTPNGRHANERAIDQAFRNGVHTAADTAVSVSLEQARRDLDDVRQRYSAAREQHGEQHPATAEQRGRVAGYELALEAIDKAVPQYRIPRWVRMLDDWSSYRGRYRDMSNPPTPWTA